MKNKTVATWLTVSYVGALCLSLIGEAESNLMAVFGLGMLVFGIWAIVKLNKLPD